MAKFIRHLIPLALLPLLPAALSAQAEKPLVSVKFTVFALNPVANLGYHALPDQSLTGLQFYGTTRSPEYTYKGDRVVQFFDMSNPDSKAPPIATWEIPTDMRNGFLMFFPNPAAGAGGMRYVVTAVDDSLEKIPPNHYSIMNVSGREYEARQGGQRFHVPEGYSGPQQAGNRVYLELSSKVNGKSMVVGGHQFELTGNERAMVVIFPPAKKSGLQPIIRSLTDTTVIEKKKGQGVEGTSP